MHIVILCTGSTWCIKWKRIAGFLAAFWFVLCGSNVYFTWYTIPLPVEHSEECTEYVLRPPKRR